jgi:glycosyltransferase involved in cell wall biosynthesis
MKKNILIISIYYPPIASIASNRIESFAKYLDKEKYNVFVHSIAAQSEYELDGVKVHRVKNDVFFKPLLFTKRTNKLMHYSKVIYNKFVNYFFENEYRGWIDASVKTLPDFIKEHNIDVVLSTFAPTAPHIVALELKKKNPSLKWIADMRDEMSMAVGISDKMRKQYQKLEHEIFEYADALTSVSKPIVDGFASMCKNDKIIFREIRNGYDFELEETKKHNQVFTIVYTGSFYGDINPDNFLKALDSIVTKDSTKKIKVQLVGVKTHFEIPPLLQNSVEVVPSVSHQKAIEKMKQSDALLLIHPKNGRKGVFTGKLFEYLAALTPIIALVDEDDVAAKLIKDANAGYVTDNANIEKIEEILIQAYDEWENKIPREFNKEIIKKHHRKEQTKRLEKLIEELYDEE